MHSTFISALAILAISIISLASPTPARTNEIPDRETGVQEARGFEPDTLHETTTSPNLSAVVKRTLQLGCTRNLICDSVVSESMCSAAFRQIIEDTTYWTGLGPEHAGTCVGNALGVGCGVFIQGPGCTISGKALRVTYHEIRQFGCTKCGWARDPKSGCEVRVDSVSRCWDQGIFVVRD